jgi:O-antigen/teichoic acid export membrane protein
MGEARTGLFRDTITTLAGRCLALFTSLLRAALIAQLLGPAGMGVYSIALSIAFYFALLGDLGLGSASIFLIGRGRPSGTVAGMTLGVGLAAGLVTGGFALGLVPWAGDGLIGGVDASILVTIALSVPLLVAGSHLESLLLGVRQVGWTVCLGLIRRASQLAVTAAALYWVDRDVHVAVACLPLSTLPSVIVGLAVLRRRTTPFALRGAPLREAVPFGLRSWVGVVAQVLNYRADLLLINLFLGPAKAGVYAIALILTEVLWYVPQSAATALYPRASSDEEPRRTRRTLAAARAILGLSVLGGIALYLAAEHYLYYVAGPKFEWAKPVIHILIPGVVAASVAKVLSSDLSGRGRPGLTSLAGLVAAASNIGLNVILIPLYGLSGAAAASAVSYTISAAVTVTFFLRVSGASFGDLFRSRPNGAS